MFGELMSYKAKKHCWEYQHNYMQYCLEYKSYNVSSVLSCGFMKIHEEDKRINVYANLMTSTLPQFEDHCIRLHYCVKILIEKTCDDAIHL